MSGLRARQKQERRLAIAEAALQVFSTQGYSSTTLEQIANVAGVSPPTVTNYYGTKQDILVSLLRTTDEQTINQCHERLAEETDPVTAFCVMDRLITRNQLDATPAHLWREIGPLLRSGELSQMFQDGNETVLKEACLLLQHYRERGVFKADLDVEFTARLLNDHLNLAFLRLAINPTQELERHSSHVRKTVELICHGILTRLEVG